MLHKLLRSPTINHSHLKKMADFGAASIAAGVAQNLISHGLGAIANNARDAALGNFTSSEGRLADKIRTSIQSDFESIKERQTSQAENKVGTGKQLISEVFAEHYPKFNVHKISLMYCFEVDVPMDRRWMLKEADIKGKEVFHDKKNSTPLMKVDAINIQQFCQIQLYKSDPQRCLSLLILHIKLIKQDNDMNEVLAKTLAKAFRIKGPVRDSTVQLYQNVRYGLCYLGGIWKDKIEDIQRAIDALNEIHPEPTLERTRKYIGVDGLLLSTVRPKRGILLAVGSSFYYCPSENKLVIFNCPHSITLEVNLTNLSVSKMNKTVSPSHYFKSTKTSIAFSNSSKMMQNIANNFRAAGTASMNESELNKVLSQLLTKKNHCVWKTESGLSIKWSDDETTSQYDLIDFVIKQVNKTNDSNQDAVPQDLISTKIVLINVKDAPQTDTVLVDLEVKIKEMKQRIWRVKCPKKGTITTEKLFTLDLPEPHFIHWSLKKNNFETVFVKQDDKSLISIAQINRNKVISAVRRQKLMKIKELNLLPKSVQENIPRRSKNDHTKKYTFAVNQFFMTERFIFVALAVNH